MVSSEIYGALPGVSQTILIIGQLETANTSLGVNERRSKRLAATDSSISFAVVTVKISTPT